MISNRSIGRSVVGLAVAEMLEPRQLLSSGWSDVVDNPYFPLLPGSTWMYKGVRDGALERVRTQVLNETKVIQGVTTTVVLDRAYRDGELVEKTYDFYAQDRAGNVWYFGENTKEYENGQVISTAGSFEAGVDGAKAGIIMLAHPGGGDAYQQEEAIGVAEDEARVLAVGVGAKTPFATFGNCLQTEDFTKLDPGALEYKYYAYGVGNVLVEDASGGLGGDTLKLVSYELAPEAFADTIDNPYFPLIPGTTYLYKGVLEGEPQKVRTTVTNDTRLVTGVTTTVVLDRVFVNDALKEKTYDYYAQDKVGNVWYFGENTKEYEDGQVVSTAGSFEAGVNGAKAGIIMPAQPGVGTAYHEEDAPGVAEDEARVLSTNQRAKTYFATFGNCLLTENFTALEPTALERKYYAPGFGVVYSEDVSGGQDYLKLLSIEYST